MFTNGASFPLNDCVMIQTNDNDRLKGSIDFSVGIGDISPDGAVTADKNFTVTITDNDGGLMFSCGVYYYIIVQLCAIQV